MNGEYIWLSSIECCVYGKQKSVIFLEVGKENKSEKLELVHTDVMLLTYENIPEYQICTKIQPALF